MPASRRFQMIELSPDFLVKIPSPLGKLLCTMPPKFHCPVAQPKSSSLVLVLEAHTLRLLTKLEIENRKS